jgi:uncharacterized protein YjiS (DUF1127 family)
MSFDRPPADPRHRNHFDRARELRAAFLADCLGRAGRLVVGALRHAREGIARAHGAYARWRQHREAIRELNSLTDAMLKDMGLHRSEIPSVVYGMHKRRRESPDDAGPARVAAIPLARPAVSHARPMTGPGRQRLAEAA